ncbi:sulfate ABC transporter substrate-binding protein [Govanella unica]|uniref:Sulfate ABC transporter substrate-binding protein n=1 Tax=Govanella unica TaxID=2975056 RepID=A0A9X3TXC2_9PROT|nr:sulfate ABC transporter substrate-binding protein [Govania unica]MDA5193407.1 sulfate ABC transporter substrate-binding protein [Govania unica]
MSFLSQTRRRFSAALIGLTLAGTMLSSGIAHADITLLNVSYDPTRELYKGYNALFTKYWKEKTGERVMIRQSHGGSGKQARSVVDGLDADVVTLALGSDIDEIARRTGKIPADWQSKLPHNSSPYTSTILFLVRKGNPKQVKDWNDLVKPGIQVVTPNPKTSGGARWNYLAAWAYADKLYNGDETKVRGFISALYKNVPVLDTGARGSTTTFVQRGIGDVLVAWENEALLALKELGPDKFEIIAPSLSILAEPPVAVVEGNAKAKKSEVQAKAYLAYLYSPEAQKLIAKNYYRPVDEKYADPVDLKNFSKLNLVTIDGAFGGWSKVQVKHFGDGGIFDQIYRPKGR